MDNYYKRYRSNYKVLFDPPYNVTPLSQSAENGDGINMSAIATHLNVLLDGLDKMSNEGPWFFVSACAFLDVLTWVAFYHKISKRGRMNSLRIMWNKFIRKCPRSFRRYEFKIVQKISGSSDYTDFLKKYFFNSNPHYNSCYSGPNSPTKSEFASIIFQTLRCGVVHSFSMRQSLDPWDTGYKILLARYCDFTDNNNHHLETVQVELKPGETPIRSVIFVAQEFIKDIRKCVTDMVHLANTDAQLKSNFINLYKTKPPLGFLDIDK